MQMTGPKEVDESSGVAFKVLAPADVLRASVPGCQQVTGALEEGFEAVVVQKVGPAKVTFKGNVSIKDADSSKGVRLIGQGSGGAAGLASGEAEVRLKDLREGGTEVIYPVEAIAGGKLVLMVDSKRAILAFSTRLQHPAALLLSHWVRL